MNISFDTASLIAGCGGVAGITGAFQRTVGVESNITDEIKEISVHQVPTPTGGMVEINLTIFNRI
jgi:hypothetical protein